MARKSKLTTEIDAKTGKAKKNLKDLDAQARKTGKGFGQTAKGGRSADRAMKGVSGQSSNASKNFSKMSQGMTGGLVPAYATLAAQIFAVTALFRFLKEAADYRVLIEGQKAFAAETGVAYNTIARALQEATDGQITFKDASQAAAIGTAAGVSPEQLNRLAGAARNVSIALGRDVTDSFNRLIRGTTKAEPELLDELGIILRLDDATRNYAATIGKTKETLTIFEKAQAVTNEVLSQAESKFGAIGDNADLQVNAIAQFAKAFDDVINKVYEFIGPIAEGLARFFSKNLYAFIGALVAFSLPILKMILPSMDAWIAKTAQSAIDHKAAFASKKADLVSYQGTLAKAKTGEGINRGAFGAQAKKMGLSTSGRGKAAAIKHYEAETTKIVKNANYKRTGILKNASATQVATLKKSYTRMMADTKGTTTKINRMWQTMGMRFKVVATGMKTAWAGTMAFMTKVGAKVGKFMSKMFAWLMVISVLVMLWDLIKPYLGDRFADKEDPWADAVEGAKNLNRELKLMANRFNEKLASGKIGGTLKDGVDMLVFQGNMATSADLEGRLGKYFEADEAGKASLLPGLRTTLMNLERVEPAFAVLNSTIATTGTITQTTSASIIALSNSMINGKMAAEQMMNAIADLAKAKNAYITGKAKLGFDAMITPAILGGTGARESAAQMRSGNAAQQAELAKYEKLAKEAGSGYTGGAAAAQYEMEQGTLYPRYKEIKDLLKEQEPRALEFDKQAKDFDDFAAKYIGFATDKVTIDRQIMTMDARWAATLAGRTDVVANQIKKEIAWKKKLFALDKARVDLKVAEDLLSEIDDKTSPKYLAAHQMVLNAEQRIDSITEEAAALDKLRNGYDRLGTAAKNTFSQALTQGIEGLIMGTKSLSDAFADMAKSVIASMARIVAELMAEQLLRALFGGMFGGMQGTTSAKMDMYGPTYGNYGTGVARYGGIMSSPGYRSFKAGGIASGNSGPGYLANLHGTEAVVPLGNDRSIPVKMMGGAMNTNNTSVVVNVEGGQATSQTTGESQGAALGKLIAASIEERLVNESRPGGLLARGGGG